MMHDNAEDRMFKDLLGDYAAPMDDNGFSANVLAKLETTVDVTRMARIKSAMVGSAAIVGTAFAGLQLPALWRFVSGLSVPTLDVPKINGASLEPIRTSALDFSIFSSSYGLGVAALGIVMLLWIGNNLLFSD
jgi:hypothetical protein